MRLSVALLFLVLLCSPGTRAGADTLPTADEIEAKHAATLGPDVTNVRDTVLSTGTLGPTKTVRYVTGKDLRNTFERGGLQFESGTYHGETWSQGFNGLTVIDEPDPGKEAPDTMTTTVSHVTTPFDAYVVSKMNARRAGTRTYYDSTTFRVGRTEKVDSTGTTIEAIDEFGTFGTRTRAKRWTVTSTASHLEQHFERSEYAEGVVTDDDVAEPPTRRHLVDFPAGVTDVSLPATFTDAGILVRVSIGSRAFDLTLDTGAAGIVLDTQLARDVGLTLTDATSEVVAQRYTGYHAIVPTLKIGTLTMRNVVVHTGPAIEAHPDGYKPLGLLGFDFLAQLGVTIDFVHRTVHVSPAEAYVPPSDPTVHEFDIRLGNLVPEVSVAVDGNVADRVILDTGFNGELAFFDYFARRYPHAFAAPLGEGTAYGVGGPMAIKYFRFPTVVFGNLKFTNFIGQEAPLSSFTYDFDGLMGTRMLSNFNLGLDYTNGRVFFTLNDIGKAHR